MTADTSFSSSNIYEESSSSSSSSSSAPIVATLAQKAAAHRIVHELRADKSTYITPLQKTASVHELKAFLTPFYETIWTDEKRQQHKRERETYPVLDDLYQTLVVTQHQVSYEDFWQRYEYRCDRSRVLSDLVRQEQEQKEQKQKQKQARQRKATKKVKDVLDVELPSEGGEQDVLTHDDVKHDGTVSKQLSVVTGMESPSTVVVRNSSTGNLVSLAEDSQSTTHEDRVVEMDQYHNNETTGHFSAENMNLEASPMKQETATEDTTGTTETVEMGSDEDGTIPETLDEEPLESTMEASFEAAAERMEQSINTASSETKEGAETNEVEGVQLQTEVQQGISLALLSSEPETAKAVKADERPEGSRRWTETPETTCTESAIQVPGQDLEDGGAANPGPVDCAFLETDEAAGRTSPFENVPETVSVTETDDSNAFATIDEPTSRDSSDNEESASTRSEESSFDEIDEREQLVVVSADTSNLIEARTRKRRSGFAMIKRVFLLLLLGTPLLSLTAIAWVRSNEAVGDALCAPMKPGQYVTELGVPESERFSAPWWAPEDLKEFAFAWLCAPRGRSRTAVDIASKGGLLWISAVNLDDGSSLLREWKRLRSLHFLPGGRQLVAVTTRGKATIDPAPWNQHPNNKIDP